MKLLLFLLLLSASARSQQLSDEFLALTKVEDAEKFYKELIAKPATNDFNEQGYDTYRAQLAVDWLYEGNVEKYTFYKKTNPKFTGLQLFELTNILEKWVDEDKNVAFVAHTSKELIDELERKVHHDDRFGRDVILYEVNAMANARLGNTSLALQQIEKSATFNSPFRQMPYFRNSTANYLNRYGFILSASGQHQRALDTLSQAVRSAASTPATIKTLRNVYKKVHADGDADKYITRLQDEAYRKIYEEVEKSGALEPVRAPEIALTDMDGNVVKLTDYNGKVVVIDFWSTECKPCVAAFPAFERIVQLYRDEPFRLFVVNVGENAAKVRPFMDKKGYQLKVLFDADEALFKSLNSLGTPQKFIIDADGKIHQTSIGYAGSDDKEFYKLKAIVEIAKKSRG